MSQQALPNVKRLTPQGNRGRGWQDILKRTHDWYANQGLGTVFEVPNAWGFVGFSSWMKQPPECRATTGDGRKMIRIKSAPDYVGSLRGTGITFDAKEFDGASIAYKNFDHDGRARQVRMVYEAWQGGNLAGYMVLEKRHMRVWWVSALVVHLWSENIRRNTPGVAKSLNFSKVVDGRIILLGVCDGYRFDYLPKLLPKLNDKETSHVTRDDSRSAD